MMVEENEGGSGNLPHTSWKPEVDSYEWYSRWALHSMAPCDDCSTEYKQVYGQLQGVVAAADSCFHMGYQLYSELSRIGHEETREPKPSTE